MTTGPEGQARASRRRQLFRAHQTAGAALSAVLLVLALTGAALVFRGCAKQPPPRAPEVARPLALAELLARAEAEAGAAITDITLPGEPGDPYVFYADDDAETALYLAGDGAVLERRATVGGVMQWLFKLHTGEIVGLPGQALALLGGAGVVALTATGLGMIASRRRRRG